LVARQILASGGSADAGERQGSPLVLGLRCRKRARSGLSTNHLAM
jgi:hypothetical protein